MKILWLIRGLGRILHCNRIVIWYVIGHRRSHRGLAMRFISKMAVAALALGFCSTAASAAVNLTGSTGLSFHPGPAIGELMLWDFDAIHVPNFTFSGSTFIGNHPNVAAPPAYGLVPDATIYGAAEPNNNAVFTEIGPQRLLSLSFDLGSLDTYNTISFYSGNTLVKSFTGSQLTDPNPAAGEQAGDANNRRYYFTFGAADDINKVVFQSTFPAFEFDNIAGALSAVPEPATWAMMIVGFGFVGFMLRNGRRQSAVATV